MIDKATASLGVHGWIDISMCIRYGKDILLARISAAMSLS